MSPLHNVLRVSLPQCTDLRFSLIDLASSLLLKVGLLPIRTSRLFTGNPGGADKRRRNTSSINNSLAAVCECRYIRPRLRRLNSRPSTYIFSSTSDFANETGLSVESLKKDPEVRCRKIRFRFSCS